MVATRTGGGRHTIPKILAPDNECIGKMCQQNNIENEMRFIMDSPLYVDLREDLFCHV